MCERSSRFGFIAGLSIAAALGGCQTVPLPPGLTPHRIEIQQGNVVTQEMVGKLKAGMTRQQVRFVMGTPPIVDPFHKDRWDYVYYLNKGGRIVEQQRLILLFEGDVLKRIEGDVVAASAGAAADKPPAAASVKPPTAAPGPQSQSPASEAKP